MSRLAPRAYRRIFVGLLALLALSGAAQIARADQPLPHTIYLPLLAGGSGPGSPTTPTPVTPTPVTPTPVTPTPEPGRRPVVSVGHDAGRAASATIGPEGGSLSATAADGTRFELSIPADALDFSEVITLTPALAVEGLPFSGGLAGAVSIEPEGLELYAPATLRIVPPGALSPAPLTIGFSYRGGGERFHLYPLPAGAAGEGLQQAAEPAITLELIEIRPLGAGRGSQADLEALPLTEEDVPMPGDYLEEVMARTETRLDNYYNKVLRYELLEADISPAELDEALRLFDAWLYFVESYGLGDEFAQEIADAKELLAEALQSGSAASAERCFSERRPEEGFRLLRWARLARKYIGAAEAAAIEAKLRGCLVFDVSMHTMITEQTEGWGWRHELHAEPFKLRWAGGMRATGSGPLTYDAMTWIGDDIGCTLSGSGAGSTFDAASGGYGLAISPVSRTSPAVRVRLSYDPGTPIDTRSIVCPDGTSSTGQRQDWRNFYAQMHNYERSGGGFAAQATVVGAGSFEGWVYSHTGASSQGALQEETTIELRHAPERP